MRSSDTSANVYHALDTLFDTRILHSIRNLQLSLLREGLCAAVSLRFDGLSGEELRVNV